ncbi:MAG: hypothetical protein ACK50J_17680 [Planctomyces sp.]
MRFSSSRPAVAAFLTLLAAEFLSIRPLSAAVQERATLVLNFDGTGTGSAAAVPVDSAATGAVADVVTIPAGATRIPDPFRASTHTSAGKSIGSSILLDPTSLQFVSIASSADLSRGDAVTVAGLFVNLHGPDDNAFRGLFAKRLPDGTVTTNYGINYNPATDALQVYVNDAAGYKVVTYSQKNTLSYRRRVHLAASFGMGDAPGADADTDADDVRIQLFINGVAAVPQSASVVDNTVAWLSDVSLAKCVSETPLTVGASFAGGELSRLIVDHLTLFPEVISESDAATLFQEVLGEAAAGISSELPTPAVASASGPSIRSLSQYGLTAGTSQKLIVTGSGLAGARLRLPAAELSVAAVEGSTAEQAVFELNVPANVVPGRYALRVSTSAGVSAPGVISIDSLRQSLETQWSESAPATEFPLAVSGSIAGTEQKRVYFQGKAGQKISAEVEARRIGSGLDPVVEIRSANNSPLAIQWQQSELAGDARATTTLPTDGVYFVEIHDLQFQAPAGSFWRLLLGDLPPASAVFPPVLSASTTAVRSVSGAGIAEPVTIRPNGSRLVLESGSALLPLGAMVTQSGVEVTEPAPGAFDPAPLDAAFVTAPFLPLSINGRISAAGESDQVLLNVTAGQALNFHLMTRRFSSPLRGELLIYNGDALVASSNGESGTKEATADYTVAEGVKQLRVQIRDFTGRGSDASIYRLQIARKDRPGFELQTKDRSVRLPANGSAPLRLKVVRQSPSFRYVGPLRLTVKGITGVTLVPEVISGSETDQEIIVVLTRSVAASTSVEDDAGMLEMEAQSQGLDPNISNRMTVSLSVPGQSTLTIADNTIAGSRAEAVPVTVLLAGTPPILFRGMSAAVPVRTLSVSESSAPFVRYLMTTTEPMRLKDPNNPAAGNKPTISAGAFQAGQISGDLFPLEVTVPTDTEASVIDAVIGAETVAHPAAVASGPPAWTAPIRFSIADAATVSAPPAPIKAARLATVSFSGKVKRHAQFSGDVSVVLEGLPAGYSMVAAHLQKDQSDYTVSLTVPENAPVGEVAGLLLRGYSGGNPITPSVPVPVVVE